jgi:hypothetical protein
MVMSTSRRRRKDAQDAAYNKAKNGGRHVPQQLGHVPHTNKTRLAAPPTLKLRGALANVASSPRTATVTNPAWRRSKELVHVPGLGSQPGHTAAARAARETAAEAPKPSGRGKLLAVGAGVTAAAVGTGVLIHTKRKEKAAPMSKNLNNPFEEVIVFGKSYPVKDVTNVRAGSPKTHTGRGVGHGQKLHEVKHKGGGGRKAGYERYKGGHSSAGVGPFG